MKQDEFDRLLIKRRWLEDKVRQFRVASLIGSSGDTSKISSSTMEEVQRVFEASQPSVLLYGSSIAGTAFEHGDADFAVVFPALGLPMAPPTCILADTVDTLPSVPFDSIGRVGGMGAFPRQAQPTVLTALYDHMKSVSSQGDAAHLQRIFRARIPILQYVPSLAELQRWNSTTTTGTSSVDRAATADSSPLARAIVAENSHNKHEHYDISLSVDGSRNSLLIRSYMQQYPSLRVACLILKQWGRQKKILNARRGLLSPYALTIMLIHYAIEANVIQASLDPSTVDGTLESVASNMSNPTPDDGTYGVEHMDTVLPMNFDDVGAFGDAAGILQGFFAYYGGQDGKFDFDVHVVDIRKAGRVLATEQWFTKEESEALMDAEKWHRVGHNVLLIRDPYENHSLGRSVDFFRAEAIREEMRLAAEGGVDIEALLPLS